jgi:hypothetical protein
MEQIFQFLKKKKEEKRNGEKADEYKALPQSEP